MAKYVLRSLTDEKNENYFMFVSYLGDNVYYLTWNPKNATRFDTIGDAMKKSAEIYEKDKRRFQAIPVEEE